MGSSTIIGIAGSLRRGSYNAALLRAACEVKTPGVSIEQASIREVPLYDGDVEAESGVPAAVQALKDRIASSDGVLLVTPEYNNSIPGVMKNAIDWLSRPPADIPRVFGGKPFAVIGASPGRFGTTLAQAAWLPVLRTLGTQPFWGSRLQVSGAGKVFDESGAIVDSSIRSFLESFVAEFAQFVLSQAKR